MYSRRSEKYSRKEFVTGGTFTETISKIHEPCTTKIVRTIAADVLSPLGHLNPHLIVLIAIYVDHALFTAPLKARLNFMVFRLARMGVNKEGLKLRYMHENVRAPKF